MGRKRVSSFADETSAGAAVTDEALDLSAFAPKTREELAQVPDAQAIRAAAEASQFTSRQPVAAAPATPVAATGQRQPRRRTTGRNQQFNLKARADVIERFIQVADAQGWVYGEAFEYAVAALEERYHE